MNKIFRTCKDNKKTKGQRLKAKVFFAMSYELGLLALYAIKF